VNVSEQARQGYAPTQFPVRTPRSIEAQLVGRVTAKLRKASEDKSKIAALAEAIHENRQMWDTLAVNVVDDANALPSTLRAQIFYLAEFTTVHSRLVLKGKGDLQPLIDINTAILRGLTPEAT